VLGTLVPPRSPLAVHPPGEAPAALAAAAEPVPERREVARRARVAVKK